MREIRYSIEFQECVEALGGQRAVDLALDTILDGVYRNPFGFEYVENDWCRIRYAITRQIDDIPPLCVWFIIDSKNNVEFVYAEEHFSY